jgi:hypothetical protein
MPGAGECHDVCDRSAIVAFQGSPGTILGERANTRCIGHPYGAAIGRRPNPVPSDRRNSVVHLLVLRRSNGVPLAGQNHNSRGANSLVAIASTAMK